MTDPGQPVDDIRQLLNGSTRHLACGADIDELLEQAADGHAGLLTEHQRHCAHCQAAFQEFSRVWEPVRRLAAEHVAVPATLKTAVASQIRKLIADVWYTCHLSDAGAISIAARVVAAIAREAARTVPGVRAAFGRAPHNTTAGPTDKAALRQHHPHAAAGVLGRTAVVDLAIAAEYGSQLEAIAREVQQRAIAELRAKAGLSDVTVNVTIDDVIT
jgi:uncharacterized alkaline shock family protein YloU